MVHSRAPGLKQVGGLEHVNFSPEHASETTLPVSRTESRHHNVVSHTEPSSIRELNAYDALLSTRLWHRRCVSGAT